MTFEAPLLLGLLLLPVVALLRSLVRGAPRPGLLATLELLPRAEDAASAASWFSRTSWAWPRRSAKTEARRGSVESPLSR